MNYITDKLYYFLIGNKNIRKRCLFIIKMLNTQIEIKINVTISDNYDDKQLNIIDILATNYGIELCELDSFCFESSLKNSKGEFITNYKNLNEALISKLRESSLNSNGDTIKLAIEKFNRSHIHTLSEIKDLNSSFFNYENEKNLDSIYYLTDNFISIFYVALSKYSADVNTLLTNEHFYNEQQFSKFFNKNVYFDNLVNSLHNNTDNNFIHQKEDLKKVKELLANFHNLVIILNNKITEKYNYFSNIFSDFKNKINNDLYLILKKNENIKNSTIGNYKKMQEIDLDTIKFKDEFLKISDDNSKIKNTLYITHSEFNKFLIDLSTKYKALENSFDYTNFTLLSFQRNLLKLMAFFKEITSDGTRLCYICNSFKISKLKQYLDCNHNFCVECVNQNPNYFSNILLTNKCYFCININESSNYLEEDIFLV